MLGNILIKLRASMKFIIILAIGLLVIVGAIFSIYKPTYEVILNGEIIGYTENKSNLQEKINQYMKSGDNDKVAFVEINEVPQYELCFLKKENKVNEEEVFTKIIETGTAYYKYYAILNGQEEVCYVENFEKSEEIINSLKEKESTNIDDISCTVKYATELKEFTGTEDAVASLYVEPIKEKIKKATSSKISAAYTQLGMALSKPITNYKTISSRYGSRWGGTHTGIDLSANYGNDIYAAADGIVTFSGGNPRKKLRILHNNKSWKWS